MVRLRLVVLAGVASALAAGTEQPDWAWPSSDDWQLGLEEWFLNPLINVQDGLPNLLLEAAGDNATLTMDEVWKLYLPDPLLVAGEQCRRDVDTLVKVLHNLLLMNSVIQDHNQLWPILLPDSWGKVPSGVLDGNIMPWGMQEECTNIVANITGSILNADFKGQYCLISYDKVQDEERVSPESRQQWARPSPTSAVYLLHPLFPPIVRYGTCMPSTCTPEDLQKSLNVIFNPIGKEASYVDCQVREGSKDLTGAEIAFICLFSLFGALVLGAAVVDLSINYWGKQHLRKGRLRFLLAFSAYSNMKKIFHINNKQDPAVISCLHGMRVLSMAWVVWEHGYLFMASVTLNYLGGGIQVSNDIMDQTVVNGAFSVDTFFFISGLLVVYTCLREFVKMGKVNWIMYYIHRFLRLTPALLFTCGFLATVGRLTLMGPMTGATERSTIQYCKDHWWVDSFYMSNFIHPNCLPQAWYTAVDMQLYVVAPLVLVPLVYKPKLGMAWMGVVTVLSCVIPATIIGVYHLNGDIQLARPEQPPDVYIDTYSTPWCRAGAYLAGMWCGWVLHCFRDKKITLKLWQTVLGWVLASTTGLLVLYGVARYNRVYQPEPLPLSVAVVYGGFGRLAWGCALFWLVFACHKGFGGAVNGFLSHPSWQPVSRLTYCLFLTSIPFQLLYMSQIYIPLYLSHINKILETCGYLFIGGIAAVILSLMTEAPILNLEKMLLARPGRNLDEAPLTTKLELVDLRNGHVAEKNKLEAATGRTE